MIEFSEIKSDFAKGFLSAIFFAILINGKIKLDAPLNYLSYLIPAAFMIWMGFLVRDALRLGSNFQYMSVWTCWKRPIIGVIAFALPLAFFLV